MSFVRIYTVFICSVYYLGVVSGWYSMHPTPQVWYNPDAIIHGGLFFMLPAMLASWLKQRRTEAK